jgi:hypothetical protein
MAPVSSHGTRGSSGSAVETSSRASTWTIPRRATHPNDETGGATFYTTGMEQSPTSATGIGWEHTFTTLRSGWRHLRC